MLLYSVHGQQLRNRILVGIHLNLGQLYDIKQIFHRHALDMRQAGACCAIIISYPNKHEWDNDFIKTPKYR